MIKVAHLADLHFRRDRVGEITIALDDFEEKARAEQVDIIAIAGDIWDGPTQNTAGAEFPYFLSRIRRLGDIAPVVMIYGTPSHDTAGSLDVFESLECKYGIHILRQGIAYYYNQTDRAIYDDDDRNDLLIFGVPEPNKKWLLANQDAVGKETADLSAAQALKNLFLGLATLRKQTPNIPCLLMYHGRVTGATFGSGEKVEDGIPADMLTMVGADYYALGDIHEPQAIPGHPNAQYVGSLYPCNWGEEHQPGWNLVEFSFRAGEPAGDFFLMDTSASFERFEFPLPQQKKISCTANQRKPVEAFRGFKSWLEISVSAEEARSVEVEELLKLMYRHGAVEGSRVTLKIIPTETVRAAEITESTKLRDKVQLWADASDLTITEEILLASDELEEEAAQKGVITSSAHIRLDRLELCGAIGIWKGQRKEKVILDLVGMDDGLIALIGENGAGKTTLIENLHPWPQMLTRTGKLQDHFMLKDSYRDLYFTDMKTGTRYRSLLMIDGKNKSGSVEYYLYQKTSRGYEPIGDINGRQAPYLEAIGELFGSLPLFLKSAFISQRSSKSNPDLSDTTNAEKKQLFAELAGIDYLAEYAEIAKTRVKDGEAKIVKTEANIEAIGVWLQSLPELREKINEGEAFMRTHEQRKAALHGELGEATASLKAAEADKAEAENTLNRISEVKRRVDDAERRIASEESAVQDFRIAAAGRDKAAGDIAEHRKLENQLAELKEKKSTIESEYHNRYQAFSEENTRAREKRTAIREKIAEVKNLDAQVLMEVQAYAKDRQKTKAELDELSRSKDCPTCGQPLPVSSLENIETKKRLLSAAIDRYEDDDQRLSALHQEYEAKIAALERQAADIVMPEGPVKLDTTNLDNQIRSISGDLEFSDITAAEATLRKADEASIRIEEIEKQIEIIGNQVRGDKEELSSLESQLDRHAGERYILAQRNLDELNVELASINTKLAAGGARLEELRDQVASLEAKEKSLSELEYALEDLQGRQEVWKMLQRACGRDGVQALELDALAPSIAETANRILEAAYGSQFAIEFRTTRMSGAGSMQKQIETFDIIIHDSVDGTEQTLETLSGGESVWIKKAIYDAFGIIRARNTGIKFLTAIQDEADGALDPAAKERYFRMLEEAHSESGRHQTMIITHSREIQEMIQQTIDISRLEAPVAEGVAI
jgi:exonuclease SbcC